MQSVLRQDEDDRRRDRGGDFRRQPRNEFLHAVAHDFHQLRAVVGDRHRREMFDRLLQAQLEQDALVHLLQLVAVLLFQFDIDARAQQLAAAHDPAGQIFLPACHRLAGVHRRQQAALHEFAEDRQAGDALLAQFLDPLPDEAVVGTRSGEAGGGARDRVLDFGGQLRQFGEHLLLVFRVLGLDDAPHHLGQPGFGAGEPAAHLLGDRQAEHGEGAVGLDFDQALHGPSRLPLGQRLVDDDEAREAAVVHEIGKDPGGATGNPGGSGLPRPRRVALDHRFGGDLVRGTQFDVRGDDQLAGDRPQPFGQAVVERSQRDVGRLSRGQRPRKAVARELRVPFPAQREFLGLEDQMRVRTLEERAHAGVAQPRQVFLFVGRRVAVVHERHVRDHRRHFHRQCRAGVELLIQALAERMFRVRELAQH